MSSKKGKYQPVGIGMVPSRTEFGKFIRDRRLELGLRQVPVSRTAKLGKGNNILSMIEIGKKKHLNPRQVEGLAEVLQIDQEELRKHMPIKPGSQPKTELGKLIRSRREELGLSLSALAKKLGLTSQKMKVLEVNNKTIRYKLMEPLAGALNLDPVILTKFVSAFRKESKSELGQFVRTRRQELGMSTRKLAKKLKVTYQFVNQIELGLCPLSQNDGLVAQLAQILEIDVKELETLRPRKRLKLVETSNPLGKFLVSRRLELHLLQSVVAQRAETSQAVVSGIERGTYRAGRRMLERISKALECEIPPELVPENTGPTSIIRVSGPAFDDLNKIKELAGVRNNSEITKRAIQLLRQVLEKQQEEHFVSVVKGEDVLKFEVLL